VKLLDLGMARKIVDDVQATSAGGWVGTPLTLAPERIQGVESPKGDLFSLGCVLYRLCTGKHPFEEADFARQLDAIRTKTPPAPADLVRNIGSELSKVVMRLLAKSPDDRYESATAVADALTRAATSDGSAGADLVPVLSESLERKAPDEPRPRRFTAAAGPEESAGLIALSAACVRLREKSRFDSAPAESLLIGWAFRSHLGREYEQARNGVLSAFKMWIGQVFSQPYRPDKIREHFNEIIATFFKGSEGARQYLTSWPTFWQLLAVDERTLLDLQRRVNGLFQVDKPGSVAWVTWDSPSEAQDATRSLLVQLEDASYELHGLLDRNDANFEQAMQEVATRADGRASDV
jgi:serine/threonine protein kinase